MGEYRQVSARAGATVSTKERGGERARRMEIDEPVITRRANTPVGWLELFYDLVFVSAVVTFSDAVSFDSDLPNIAVVAAAFTALWLVWLA